MKKVITLTILLVTSTVIVSASGYENTMLEKIKKMYQTTSVADLTNLGNQFSRIANVEKDEWLPGYYAALCYLRSTYFGDMDAEKIHKQLDLAQSEIGKVLEKAPKESEVHALQAHIYQIRITDMDKAMKYSILATESLNIAEKLNAGNPRVYYLKGCNVYHTPENFGGGAANAKPLLEKAAKLFESFTPENKLMPNWGVGNNGQLLEQCNTTEK